MIDRKGNEGASSASCRCTMCVWGGGGGGEMCVCVCVCVCVRACVRVRMCASVHPHTQHMESDYTHLYCIMALICENYSIDYAHPYTRATATSNNMRAI